MGLGDAEAITAVSFFRKYNDNDQDSLVHQGNGRYGGLAIAEHRYSAKAAKETEFSRSFILQFTRKFCAAVRRLK